MEKKMKLDDAMFIIANILEDSLDYEDPAYKATEIKAWKRIREVIKNSEEYKKEKESK